MNICQKFKIALRPNIIYPMYLILWTFLRKIISILISNIFHFKGSVIYTFLMFLGEFIGGFIIFKYQNNFVEKNETQKVTKTSTKFSLIQQKAEMKSLDGYIKINFLIFMTGFFDFFEFILSTYYINKIHKISGTLQMRLGGILIITSSLLYWHLLKFQLFKHQFFSMIIIFICILILISTEYSFQRFDGIITAKDLTFAVLFSALSHISIGYNNTIEKYIIDFNFLNAFYILYCQGIIGIIFTIICAIVENPLPALKNIYDNNSIGMFILFIFLLLLYSIFGALKNIYRMATILLFTPMNKHLADIMINPIYIIYYFVVGQDFKTEGEKNYLYFFTNLIILIIFDICGLIFNEFLILYCCGLDHDTHRTISFRAAKSEEMDILTMTDEGDEADDNNF